jgi:hypothetical protein
MRVDELGARPADPEAPPAALPRGFRREPPRRRFRNHPAILAVKRFLRLPAVAAALWRDRQKDFPHELAVAAIFKDEARFLDEWLTFHRGVGVSHFYLYDNGSTDDFREVLAPWIGAGLVTLTDFPGSARQVPAYNHCISHFRREARWIAFIDIDEFLFSPLARDIRPILAGYRDLPALFVYWLMFCSSGHVARPEGPILEAYTRREQRPDQTALGKVIVNPRLVREMIIHTAKTWVGEPLDERRRVVPDLDYARGAFTGDRLRINHYWSKSIQDLNEKVRRGRASTSAGRVLEAHLAKEKTMNDVEDLTIQPVWAAIKAALPPDDGQHRAGNDDRRRASSPGNMGTL